MKSAPENELPEEEVTDETDEQENAPETEESAPEESVRNYSPSKLSAILSKKFLIFLIILVIAAVSAYFTLFNKNDKPAPVEKPLPKIIAAPAPPAEPQNTFSSAAQPLNLSLWKEFDLPGKFKVTFPGAPEHENGKLETDVKDLLLKLDSYYVTIEDANNYTVFFANALDFPPSFAGGDDAILEQALKSVATTDENGKIISSTPTNYNEHKATDFLLQAGEVWLKGKIIVSGKTAFLVAEAYFDKNYNESDYNKFVNSLVIY